MSGNPDMGKLCRSCDRPHRQNCCGGEMEYADGSSRACPNWNMKLDEIGGMTREEAEDAERYRIARNHGGHR